MASAGRQTVAPGQVIGSAWGNAAWDHTVECFDTNAHRDSAFPAPHDGATCFTVDTRTFWRYTAGAWAEGLVSDTGWVNMTPSSGTGACQYRARGGMVEVRLNLSGVTGIAVGSSAVIVAAGVLPAAYRPGQSVWVAGSFGGAGMCLGAIGTDGSVTSYNPGFNAGALNVARYTFVYMKEV